MARVLLINPPWYRILGSNFEFIPLGLCYIAGVLRENGHEVAVYNADFRRDEVVLPFILKMTKSYQAYEQILSDLTNPIWREVEDRIRTFRPDIVGITAMTPKYSSAVNVAKIVKQFDPSVSVVMGGPHPTVLPTETAKNGCVDAVVRGEGEYSFLELENAFENGKVPRNILGITYKHNNRIVSNPNRPLIEDIDKLPFPARDLVLDKESYFAQAFGVMFTSRGCPYSCIFCASNKIWGKRVRFRSPENVVAEIKYVCKIYGTRYFQFEDDTFTLNKKRTERICDLIKQEDLDIEWCCDTRTDLITDDLLKKMRAAGCTSVNLGIESGNENILKISKKGITLNQTRNAVKLTKKHGLKVTTYFMIGLLGETKDTIMDTINFMYELSPDMTCLSITTAYPGTELFEMAMNKNLIAKENDWASYFHQSPEMVITENIAPEEFRRLVEMTEKIFDKYNRKKIIYRNLKCVPEILWRYRKRPATFLKTLREVLRSP